MSPITLPASLQTPAMSRAEPFGLSRGRVAQHDLPAGLELVELLVGCEVAARHVLDGDREAVARLAAGE